MWWQNPLSRINYSHNTCILYYFTVLILSLYYLHIWFSKAWINLKLWLYLRVSFMPNPYLNSFTQSAGYKDVFSPVKLAITKLVPFCFTQRWGPVTLCVCWHYRFTHFHSALLSVLEMLVRCMETRVKMRYCYDCLSQVCALSLMLSLSYYTAGAEGGR